MQDGPMRPASRMNESSNPITFHGFMVLVVFFWLMVGADCVAIWFMR